MIYGKEIKLLTLNVHREAFIGVLVLPGGKYDPDGVILSTLSVRKVLPSGEFRYVHIFFKTGFLF